MVSSLLKIKDRIFYGWVIVATSLVIAITLQGIRLSFGVFFKSLESEFGLTRAAVSSVFSANMVVCAVFAIVGGWAADRYGPRLVILLMGLLTGISLLLTSQVSSFWQLFLSYSILLSIGTGARYAVLMSAVSRWFDKKRGFALGIAGAGGPLGPVVMAPFAAYLISNLGWRMSYMVMGLVAWVVVISLSTLLKNHPGEIGVLPDGVKLGGDVQKPKGKGESTGPTGFSLLRAFRTRSFWLFGAVWLFFSFCLHLILTHVVPYAMDMGISATEAATILSIAGGFNILSRVLIGRASDIIGRKAPGIICALLQAGALLGLIWARDLWMLYLFAVVFGLSWGGVGIVTTGLIVDIFGGGNLGAIMGTLDIGFFAGAAIGPAITGLIFDVTSSYTAAFAIGAAAMLITALLVASTRREASTEIS